jgi:hypothetical protein
VIRSPIYCRAADRVILEPTPLYEQQVFVPFLNTPLQLVRNVSGRQRYYILGLVKCVFESLGLPGAHLKKSNFEDHSFAAQIQFRLIEQETADRADALNR